ncbi:MAG: T9SS type A sorting domain-containing protein [Bacteroidetes bacterium]|nr:T9SS type A sorting domain-containing protein [Bacteroidota bacterium]
MKRILLILSVILLTSGVLLAQQTGTPIGSTPERIIKFYPNPAASSINFDFQKNYDKGYSIQVYNFLGKLVSEIKNVSPKSTLNVSEFNRGIYIYQLKDNNGKILESGKFQVAR